MISFVCTLALVGGLLVFTGGRAVARPLRAKRVPRNPVPAVAAALAGGSLALIVTAVPAFACIAAIASAGLPSLMRQRRARSDRMARAQAWPGVLDDVTSAVRAGLNLPEALAQAGNRAPGDLRAAFTTFETQYRRTGDFGASLEDMRRRVGDDVFDQLVHSLSIARRVGGHDLTQVLRSLGTFVRADVQIRGELLARQSWSVNAARMAVAAPWVVLVMLSTRPSTIEAYRTTTGALVLLAVAGLSAVAYAGMLRIARLDGARR